jgi:AsmA protein
MKAFGKILGLCLLGLLLITVALGFALGHLFDPNDYKSEIRQLARDKARVELTLNGDIGWSLFPWLGLELHDASVATLNAPDKPFADLQMLGLSVRVLPLLRREVQMSDVRVEGLNLTLARDENGHGNWEDIGKPLASATPADPGASTTSSAPVENPENSARVVKLDIDSLTVNNAAVHYTDAKSGQVLSADSIQLSTGAVHEGADIPVKLTAFLGTNQPVLRARTELAGALRLDRTAKRYQFEDMRLSGEVSGDPLQGQSVTYSAQGQLLLDLTAQIAEWGGLKFSANQLRALGEIKVANLDSQPQLSGGLSIASFDLRAFLGSIGQTLPPMAAADSLKNVEMVARLHGTKNSLALEDLNLKLDGGSYSGRLAVDDFAKKALRVQLQGDKLDADRYLPPRSADAASASAARQSEVADSEAGAIAAGGTTPLPDKPTHGAWSTDRLLPIQLLRDLDLRADLSLGQLTLHQLPIQNAFLKAEASGGLLTLEQLSGSLYNGSFQTSGLLDVRPEQPLLALQSKLERVPVERFLKTRNPNPPITGLLTLDSDPGPRQYPESPDRQPRRHRQLRPRQWRAGQCQPRAAALPGPRRAQPQKPLQHPARQGHAVPSAQGQPGVQQRRGQQPRLQREHSRPERQRQWRHRPARAGHGLPGRHPHRGRSGRHARPGLPGQRPLQQPGLPAALPRSAGTRRQGLPRR